MKGLLQSKIFRKNLKKWLCMYVGALMILTTVVTYSKYISKYNVDDEARVTKFDVTINNIKSEGKDLICEGEADKLECLETNKYRPTTKVPYEFIVTPNFEVNTLLATTIYVPIDFNIEKLEEVNGDVLYDPENNIEIVKPEKLQETNTNGEKVDVATIITIKRNINMYENNANEPKIYRITTKYNYDEDSYKAEDSLLVIKVGYSATQVKN